MNTLSKTEHLAALVDLTAARFENSFVRELPGDPESRNVPRAVRNACYTRVEPTPVTAPRLLAWSDAAGEMLGIARPGSAVGPAIEALGGNRVLPGMEPYAARYGGHQFGTWAGQLGDGRAITLAEIVGPDGARRDLQLKGAGPTPYSRTADGRAVLRSSVREFLCSEAMHYLGVPTTRALSLVGTGDAVVRDMFYDGNPRPEPGAIVCRVAPSFVRFGNFEILAASGENDLLKRLADYVITGHYKELGTPSPETYARWFEEVCRRTAVMIVEWMRVGFVHGVMNTDNMSILGLTIDYGPYGWVDDFDLDWTPNTTDAQGRRYRFGQQAQIAYWNVQQLANALVPAFESVEPLKSGLQRYVDVFMAADRANVAAKLGLVACREADEEFMRELYGLLQGAEVDMTIFFRTLADLDPDAPSFEPFAEAFYDEAKRREAEPAFRSWLGRYAVRVHGDGLLPAERRKRMNAANPKYVLRNYLAQEAIDRAERGDDAGILELLDVLRHPYDEQPGREKFAQRRPDWARNRAGCSMLSCSS